VAVVLLVTPAVIFTLPIRMQFLFHASMYCEMLLEGPKDVGPRPALVHGGPPLPGRAMMRTEELSCRSHCIRSQKGQGLGRELHSIMRAHR
jgi:hypothetical protein